MNTVTLHLPSEKLQIDLRSLKDQALSNSKMLIKQRLNEQKKRQPKVRR